MNSLMTKIHCQKLKVLHFAFIPHKKNKQREKQTQYEQLINTLGLRHRAAHWVGRFHEGFLQKLPLSSRPTSLATDVRCTCQCDLNATYALKQLWNLGIFGIAFQIEVLLTCRHLKFQNLPQKIMVAVGGALHGILRINCCEDSGNQTAVCQVDPSCPYFHWQIVLSFYQHGAETIQSNQSHPPSHEHVMQKGKTLSLTVRLSLELKTETKQKSEEPEIVQQRI